MSCSVPEPNPQAAPQCGLACLLQREPMSSIKGVSAGTGHGWGKALADPKSLLALSILLLCGMVHATPITNILESQQSSRTSADRRMSLGGKQSMRLPETAATPQAKLAAAVDSTTGGCILSTDCSSTVQVPEPQSLVLVGSGLLSMAGLIRRRLLR